MDFPHTNIVGGTVVIDFNTRSKRDAAVIAAIVTNNKTLVIRQPDRNDPQWKFPGGTVESHESIYEALIREIHDESGFEIPFSKNPDGTLVLGNESVVIEYLDSVVVKTRNGEHDQHQFLIRAKDERDILYLDRQILKEDDEETIETRVFNFDELEGMRDFLWHQLKMLRKAKTKLAEIGKAAA